LEDVAAAFREALPREGHRLEVFRLDPLDRLGVPVCEAALLPESGGATAGYGYGLTPVEAEVGALGELIEEFFVGRHLCSAAVECLSFADARRLRGPRGVADPRILCLPAGCAWTEETPLHWVEARRWPEDGSVLMPRDWVAAHPYQIGGAWDLALPITNGLGAGFDLAHAIAHGAMELLQRDGNSLTYRALDRGVVVEPGEAAGEEVSALLARLRAAGVEPLVKLAATEFGLANLYVVGDDASPGFALQLTACGEAAHPDRARALRKALLEFCGSRARKTAAHGPLAGARRVVPPALAERLEASALSDPQEERAVAAMAEWLGQPAEKLRRRLEPTAFREERRVALAELPDQGPALSADSAARLGWIARALAREGLEILWVDCSAPGAAVRAVRVIVPGLECETMSYGRLGWRGARKLRERGDPLLLDAPRDGARRVVLRAEDEARAGGPCWLDWDLAQRLVGGLYPLYREPGAFAAQLAREGRRRPLNR
jgi:ribosomal protein S12 methylthiotransferase accessory factor